MGHPAAEVWRYTPRQIAAFLFIANRRRVRLMTEDLWLQRVAAHGDEQAMKKALKELS